MFSEFLNSVLTFALYAYCVCVCARASCVRVFLHFCLVLDSWPMFSAFLYFLAMAFTIPVLPKVVNELVTGSKAVSESGSCHVM